MIKSITLKNFKCYKHQSFDFSELTIFCGNNSSGKSTVIQALLLIMQNNFSSTLDLSGDYIQPGGYNDIHNRNADDDSLVLELVSKEGNLSWGYNEKEIEPQKQKEIEEIPLPLLSCSDKSIIEKLRQLYKDNFIYLNAERWGPRSNYPYSIKRRSPYWLGINGEYAPQVLESIANSLQVMKAKDERIHLKLTEESVVSLAQNLYEWMGEISPGVFIRAQSLKDADITTNQYSFGGQFYRAVNVGFGLSYVLPIVLALLTTKPGGLIIIENPEAHLHPKGQSYLGRLIALTAMAGIQVILETHSDHLLNGIRVVARLREDYKNGMAKVYFISSGDEQSTVDLLPIDTDGEIPYWPNGFFDQQALDVKSIITGQNITDMPRRKSSERK